jgi:hypothetical protein
MRAAALAALALVLAACGHQGSGPSDEQRREADREAGTWCAVHVHQRPGESITDENRRFTKCLADRTEVELARIVQRDTDKETNR